MSKLGLTSPQVRLLSEWWFKKQQMNPDNQELLDFLANMLKKQGLSDREIKKRLFGMRKKLLKLGNTPLDPKTPIQV